MDQISNDWWPKFSEAEYERRYDSLRAAMAERGLDCLVVFGMPLFFGTDPGAPNLIYLSAYAPGLQGYVVFPREGAPMMAIYVASHLANARRLSIIADVRAGTDLPGLVRDRIDELGLAKARIGVVGNFAWSKSTIPVEGVCFAEPQFQLSPFQRATGVRLWCVAQTKSPAHHRHPHQFLQPIAMTMVTAPARGRCHRVKTHQSPGAPSAEQPR
jgi:hypothetical protein